MAGHSLVQRVLTNQWVGEPGVPNIRPPRLALHYGAKAPGPPEPPSADPQAGWGRRGERTTPLDPIRPSDGVRISLSHILL